MESKKAFKIAGIIACIVIVAFCFFNCFYIVSEQEQAVVTQFGKVIYTNTAGAYMKLPFIQSVHMVDMTTHGVGIGYVLDDKGQNITIDDEGIMITSDFNFVDIDFYMEYKVSDPIAYLYNSTGESQVAEHIMKNMALAAIRSTVADFTVDEVITTGKSQIQARIKMELADKLNKADIGLQVVNLTIQDAEPPTNEIKTAFKDVETAKQSKETKLNNAKQYNNEQIPAAEAEADKIVQNAEATKAARIAQAKGEVAKFNSMYAEYEKYPLITKQRMFYEAIENILPNAKVIITDGETQELLPIEQFGGN